MDTFKPVAIHPTALEALMVDTLLLLDEVETLTGDEQVIARACPMSANPAILRAGPQLVLSLSNLAATLSDELAQTHLKGHGVQTIADFAAWDEASLPPPVRALGAAASALFERWDGLRNSDVGGQSLFSPARSLQRELARRMASGATIAAQARSAA